MSDRTVGFIGTGIMGAPMARNLMRAGYVLHVFNRTKSRAAPLVSEGARWCGSPAEAAKDAAIVITLVTDSPDVEQVYLGPCGVLEGASPGALCVDMSTVSPDTARLVERRLAQRDIGFLDAPVSGGKTGAEAGTLAIMVGGVKPNLERAMPVFDVLGKSVVHCGPVGSGQLTKLCNQILCGLNLLAVAEAITFAKKVELEPATMLEAVASGAAGSWALSNLGPRMLARDFAPMFMVDLQQKDLQIALDAARAASVPLPGTGLVTQLLRANQAAGEGREGTQALVKVLERLANFA